MRFLWPELLWLLLLLPLMVAAYVGMLRRKRKVAVRYASLRLVREALGPRPGWRRHVPPLLFLLAVAAALLAAARPSAEVTLPTSHATLILAIDVSRSMRATDVAPSRIEAAQAAAKEFISELPKYVRVGIVTFAGTAVLAQPPTEDRDLARAAIDHFELQFATATGSGLLVALAALRPDARIDLEPVLFGGEPATEAAKARLKPVPPGSYSSGAIIMLTDGRRTTGPDPLDVAELAADLGVKVHTVGFGTTQGAEVSGTPGWSFFARFDEQTLKAIARFTGGEYFHASSAEDLRRIYKSLNTQLELEHKESELSALFAAAAAALLAAAGLLSMLWFRTRL
jgi:Ca-activated chloride channel family protein